MKWRKRLLAFVLAGVMITSNVAYASPEGGTENVKSEVVDTLSLNPDENAGGEYSQEAETSDESEETSDKSDSDAEEVSRPEQTLKVTVSDGAVITITAPEGALPEGAQVSAEPVDSNLVYEAVDNAVSEQGKQLLSYRAYDITILAADGTEIQPQKNISVSISNAGVAGTDKEVYHIADGSKKAEKVADVTSSKVSTFSAEHFSIYVVAGSTTPEPGEEDVLTVTISFVYETGVIVADPFVLNVEKVNDSYNVDYEIPEKEGYTPILTNDNREFQIVDGHLTGIFDDNTPKQVEIQYMANTTEYTVKHLYENLNGEYVEDSEAEEIKTGKVGELTEATEKTKEGFTSLGVEQKVIEESGTVVEIKYERNTCTLTYLTLGGSYVPSVSAKYETNVDLTDANPTRTGYTFVGWYTDEECTQKAADPFTLKADTKLYAKWDGAIVNYSVVYLTENADDDNYSYAGTVTLSAKAGTKVSADANTQKPSEFDTKNFTFKESSEVVVDANGSSVVTVKYSRNVYTIVFPINQKRTLTCEKAKHTHTTGSCYELICDKWHFHSISKGCYELVCNQEEHRHSEDCYSYTSDLMIKAKYEANIKDQWMELVGPETAYGMTSWYWDGGYTSLQTKMPEGGKVITGKTEYDSHATKRTLTYYVESSEGTVEYKNKTFVEYAFYTIRHDGYPTFNEEFMPIDGYERFDSNIKEWADGIDRGDPSRWDNKENYFYYTCSNYQLELVNGEQSSKYNVPYLSNIEQYLGEPEYNPLGDGTFDGWYLDPQFQSKYDGDYTMPKNLVLYAKWNPVTYEVNFVDSADTSEVYATQTIESKGLVDVIIPEKDGYVFKGWYTSQDCADGTEFDYATQITAATTLYAKWAANSYTTYTVEYVTDDDRQVAESETHSGKAGSTVLAKAKNAEGDFAGYTVDAASKTLVLQPDASENVIKFTYTKVGKLNYTVRYVNEEGNVLFEEPVASSEANYIKVSVGESALKEILKQGYEPNQNYQWVSLTTGENVVTFTCKETIYNITYKNVEGATNNNPDSYNAAGLKSNPITLEAPELEGKVFAGWEFTSKDGEVVSNNHNPSNTTINAGSYGDLEFTACWATLKVTGYYESYDGEEHSAAATVDGVDGYTFKYSTDNGENWSETAPSIKNVGTVNFKVQATKAGYATLESEGSLTVIERNVTLTSKTDSKTYDGTALKAETVKADGFVKDEGASYSDFASITNVGTTANTFKYTLNEGTLEGNYDIQVVNGTLKVTDGDEETPVDPDKVVVKKHTGPEEGRFKVGDVVTFDISVTNIYDEVKTITLSEIDGVTLAKSEFADVQPGAVVTTTATYTITEADVVAGEFVNTVTAKFSGEEKTYSNDDTVDELEDLNGHLAIAKSVVNQKDEYEIGDTIEYQITVTNTGNVTQNDIVVEDQLNAAGNIVITDVNGADGSIDGAEVTLDTLAPGKAATISCEYTVLKADRGSTITNVAVADDADGEDPVTPEVPAEVTEVYDIDVVHENADGEDGDASLPEDYTIENLEPGTTRAFTAEAVAGYTAYPAEQTATVEDRDEKVVFTYYRDEIGTDPDNPDTPDGIPDIYQAAVTYRAINGILSFRTAVVTLFDENGQPAANGTGYLTADQIPFATALSGYNQESAEWGANGAPTTKVAITEDITFTVAFSVNPAIPVPTPDPATPAPTATAADPAAVDGDDTLLDNYKLKELDKSGDEVTDVEEIDNEASPHGNFDPNNEHACCILHFLLLLIALVIELIYTYNRKKGQERIFELRRQIADSELLDQDSQA